MTNLRNFGIIFAVSLVVLGIVALIATGYVSETVCAIFEEKGDSLDKLLVNDPADTTGIGNEGDDDRMSRELNGESFEPLAADVAIKVPEGNETAIIDGTIVIFNQSKFEKLFQYDYKSQLISEQKAKELQDAYSLSFPEGLTLNALLEDKKPLVKKLQNIEVGEMKQDELLDYADQMQLELMTDDQGKIIIMDDKDLGMFVNLLNEDYFVSPVNGKRYEIKSKKLLGEPDGEPPRG